jgi:hypothetical protein
MFKSLFGLVADVATIIVAPVAIAAPLIREVTKPIAETVEDIVDTITGN